MEATERSKTVRHLPEKYCPACAAERPEEFEFIRNAEDEGAIIFTGQCPKHALEFFAAQAGIVNARIEDGRLACQIGGRTFGGAELLPASGMKFAVLHACPRCGAMTETDYGPCPDCANTQQAEAGRAL